MKYKSLPTVIMHYSLLTIPSGLKGATAHHMGETYILSREEIEKAILFYIEENLQGTRSE